MSDDQNEASGLRKQLEEALAENKELKQYRRQNELGTVLGEFGLDPNKGPGKFVTSAYDGEVSADAFREWLAAEGFEPQGEQTTTEQAKPAGVEQRTQQQQKLAQLRETSESGTDQKVTGSQLRQIAKTDPQRAKQLMNTPGAVVLEHLNA